MRSSFYCLGGFGVPLLVIALQNTRFAVAENYGLSGGGMHKSGGEQGGTAGEVDVTQSNESVSGDSTGRLPDPGRNAVPVTEISDKDYRSFCWPCNALEETGDGKPDE